MSWNHRIIFHREKPARNSYFAVHECHYERDGDKIPMYWTTEAIRIIEDSVDYVRVTLTRIRKACNQPILTIKGKKLVVYSALQNGPKLRSGLSQRMGQIDHACASARLNAWSYAGR